MYAFKVFDACASNTTKGGLSIKLALRESQQITLIQSDHLSIAYTRLISGAPDLTFSHEYTAINTRCHS